MKNSKASISGSGMTSPMRGYDKNDQRIFGATIDWSNELREIKNKLQIYEMSVSQLLTSVGQKQDYMQEVIERTEDQVQNTLTKFLTTHDIDLVKQYFTNTVLTPTEVAHIIAKTNAQISQQMAAQK